MGVQFTDYKLLNLPGFDGDSRVWFSGGTTPADEILPQEKTRRQPPEYLSSVPPLIWRVDRGQVSGRGIPVELEGGHRSINHG
jgi:hypothetical protein